MRRNRKETSFVSAPALTERNRKTGGFDRLPTQLSQNDQCRRPKPLLPKTAYFADGNRQIDLVLAFKPVFKPSRRETIKAQFRQKFENEMRTMGLELEPEDKASSPDGKTSFIKVHATWTALARQAECDRLQMPVALCDVPRRPPGLANRLLSRLCRLNPFYLPEKLELNAPEYFTDNFERAREDDFLNYDPDTFFSSQQRIFLTHSIMESIQIKVKVRKHRHRSKKHHDILKNPYRRKESKIEVMEIPANISYLLREGVYTKVFALHDCSMCDDRIDYSKVPVANWPLRHYLHVTWAQWRRWHKYQPLNVVRDYYGEKVAMYFAWLGFYTHMLVLPAMVGCCVFVYGLTTADNDFTQWFCDSGSAGNPNVVFCREAAAVWSRFTPAQELCGFAWLSRVFDNFGATAYAVFMSIWVICFLEFWKRYQAQLSALWDVPDTADVGAQQVRPEYSLAVSNRRLNPVTQEYEPYMPRRSFYQRLIASMATAVFFVSVVVLLMLSVMVYKAWSPNLFVEWFTDADTGKYRAPVSPQLLASITASLANGVFIGLMSKIYAKISWVLTSLEMPRTEAQFETSYTYKMFLFQFINYYGALFFLAFIRGQVTSSPLEPSKLSPSSRCPPTGCLLDVSIQLFIILTGKQVLNNGLELGLPLLKNLLRRSNVQNEASSRLEEDFLLEDTPELSLFSDCMEMIIQYGFITMFVAAFPLAPLFALINNVFEIRLDAFKMLTQTKRFIPSRARNIEPWGTLLTTVSKLAVLTNAVLIALTSGTVDNLVYSAYYGQRFPNYMQFSIVPFNTSTWCTRPGLSELYNSRNCVQLLYPERLSADNIEQLHVKLDRLPSIASTSSSDNNNNHTLTWPTAAGKGSSDAIGNTNNTLPDLHVFLDALQAGHNLTLHKPLNRPVSTCYYRTYRDQLHDYGYSFAFFVVYMFKLFFVICFEHFMFAVQVVLEFLIPDVPEQVKVRVKREAHVHRENFKRRELRTHQAQRSHTMTATSSLFDYDEQQIDSVSSGYVGSELHPGGGSPAVGFKRRRSQLLATIRKIGRDLPKV